MDSPQAERAHRGKPLTNRDLVEHLCNVSASLREARRLHLGSFGTLVPHVFMSDVLARVGCCLQPETRQAAGDGELVAILESLEQGMAYGDQETRNVISVSFVGDGELEVFFPALKPLLGPRVRAQLQGK